MPRAAIVGDGAFGTAVALLLADRGLQVSIWSHDADYAREVEAERRNRKFLPGVALPPGIRVTGDLAGALSGAEFWVVAVPSLYLPAVLDRVAAAGAPPRPVVSVTKGIDRGSLALPSALVEKRLRPPSLGVLSGPSHAPEVARRLPTAVVAASADPAFARQVQAWFSTGYFRVYTHDDPLGVELGGALKQQVAIAAGVCDGLGFGDNSKSTLLTRGLAEIVRLGEALGARRETFAGLSGVGDLVTSCWSTHGRNRAVGAALGQGRNLAEVVAGMNQVAEGVTTVESVCRLAEGAQVEMPIALEVRRLLGGKDARTAVRDLMSRDLKAEFW